MASDITKIPAEEKALSSAMAWTQYPAYLPLEKTTFPSQSPVCQEGPCDRGQIGAFANRHSQP